MTDCEICDDNTFVVWQMHQCKIRSCLSCIISFCKVRLQENDFNLKCPCGSFLTDEEVGKISSDILEKKRSLSEKVSLLSNPNFVFCCVPDCNGTGNKSNDSPLVTCTPCNHKVCFDCREIAHEGSCAERQIKNSQTIEWLKVNSKNCPKCSVSIEFSGGCPRITCASCGCIFCWTCGEEYTANHAEKHFPRRQTQRVMRSTRTNVRSFPFDRETIQRQMRFSVNGNIQMVTMPRSILSQLTAMAVEVKQMESDLLSIGITV